MAEAARDERHWAREYETIYILRPDVDPEEADKVAQRVGEVLTRLGGKLTKVDNWGKRKLAYPIRRFSRGIFVYLKYVAFGDVVSELERNLRMLDPVVRYQTVKLRDQVDPAAVEVDPDEVKFLRIETGGEEEEEPNLEQRLGMAPRQEPRDDDEFEASGEEEE
ncbi:MAG: 30S ribosomal protein S6 [Myxococcota bacterium]